MEEQDERPVRFKSQGRVKKSLEIKPFRGGGWKYWLEFQLRLTRVHSFLRLDESTESMRDLHEVVTQRLSGNDLDQFNEQYAESLGRADPPIKILSAAMETLARKILSPRNSGDATRRTSKSPQDTEPLGGEYGTHFNHLLQLESWILPDDGTALTSSEKCRYLSAGMPRSWQMQVMIQRRGEKVNDLKD
ncbi:hypothetical protein GN244_ATG01134 [Phytophthora infestans]|uniref:Uncharacterized protein n=1 Tax=Phytophthora infestans TaxID=4787 RepID=A0A833WN63_PHYIN|nr:hypothetical protein GN244_ATG01134 [Phytophthora infestans]